MYNIIVLNLQRSKDRREIMEKQFKKLELDNHYFFPAFDGRNIMNTSFRASITKGAGLNRKLLNAEISIIMTHIAALKMAQSLDI